MQDYTIVMSPEQAAAINPARRHSVRQPLHRRTKRTEMTKGLWTLVGLMYVLGAVLVAVAIANPNPLGM